MSFIENDDVIKQVAAAASYPTFRDAVLPHPCRTWNRDQRARTCASTPTATLFRNRAKVQIVKYEFLNLNHCEFSVYRFTFAPLLALAVAKRIEQF